MYILVLNIDILLLTNIYILHVLLNINILVLNIDILFLINIDTLLVINIHILLKNIDVLGILFED